MGAIVSEGTPETLPRSLPWPPVAGAAMGGVQGGKL